jgi:hypothetical protein
LCEYEAARAATDFGHGMSVLTFSSTLRKLSPLPVGVRWWQCWHFTASFIGLILISLPQCMQSGVLFLDFPNHPISHLPPGTEAIFRKLRDCRSFERRRTPPHACERRPRSPF